MRFRKASCRVLTFGPRETSTSIIRGLHGSASRCRHPDNVGIRRAFYPITGRQKCIEPLDESGMAIEKVGNTLDDARSIDAKSIIQGQPQIGGIDQMTSTRLKGCTGQLKV